MMKSKGKFILTLSAGALALAAIVTGSVLRADDKASSTANKTDDLFPDKVIARGTGVELKRSALDEAVSRVRAEARAHGQQISPMDMALLEKDYFDQLLQVQLLNAKATAAQKATGTTNGDQAIAKILKNATNPEMLTNQLKALNLTVESLHQQLIHEGIANAVLRDKIPAITDEDIKKFYDENPSKFELPEQVRASHILIGTGDPRNPMTDDQKKAKRKLAEDILKRAKAGEDFAKLAKEYSEDPGSKDKGGEYVFGRHEMMPEFEAAAFSLQTNQISDIVTTVYGYHIIKLSEKMPAKKVDLAEAKPRIKGFLEQTAMEKMLPQYYATLKKEAKVEILDDHLKALEEAPAPAKPDAIVPAPTSK
jgi:parvulin-like peptidyl-prolyl isomerase